MRMFARFARKDDIEALLQVREANSLLSNIKCFGTNLATYNRRKSGSLV